MRVVGYDVACLSEYLFYISESFLSHDRLFSNFTPKLRGLVLRVIPPLEEYLPAELDFT
jgi:hypothetical protein